MSRGKVTLDGQEYEIEDVLDSDAVDGGRVVQLSLVRAIGPADRLVYEVPVNESITEWNIRSMEKGDQNTILNSAVKDDGDHLVQWVGYMEPGTALVIIRGQQ